MGCCPGPGVALSRPWPGPAHGLGPHFSRPWPMLLAHGPKNGPMFSKCFIVFVFPNWGLGLGLDPLYGPVAYLLSEGVMYFFQW